MTKLPRRSNTDRILEITNLCDELVNRLSTALNTLSDNEIDDEMNRPIWHRLSYLYASLSFRSKGWMDDIERIVDIINNTKLTKTQKKLAIKDISEGRV